MSKLSITGFILAGIEAVVSLIVIYLALSTKMVPQVPGILGSLLLVLIPFLVFLLAKKKSKKPQIAAIVISGLMCVMMGVATYYLYVTTKAINKVTGESVEVDEINVYVSKDDPVTSINEAVDNGYVFGIINNDDTSHVDETIQKIESDLGVTISTQEYESIFGLIGAFEGGTIQSFITNTGSLLALDSTEEYVDYTKNLKVIMENKITEKLEEVKVEETDKDRFCAYFSGIDTFGSVTARSRSDVNIIGVINNQTKQVLLLSTPRDYYVEIAGTNGKKDKLTHAGIYGIESSMGTLENLYDTDISYYVRINFSGFQSIIDTLGGVDVYSDQSFTSITEEGTYSYEEGINHLNGEEALGFARCRYAFIDGDRQRGRNQMQVIKATIEKLESAETLKKYSSLMDDMSDSFQTDMAKDEVGYLVQSTLDNGNWTVLTYSVGGSDSEQVCYSLGTEAYVMLQNEGDIAYGKELIDRVLSGEIVTQDEINQYIETKDSEDMITEQVPEEDSEDSAE